jgi:hypothetical protein
MADNARAIVRDKSTLHLTAFVLENPAPCCVSPVELGLSTHTVDCAVTTLTVALSLAPSSAVVEDNDFPSLKVAVAARLSLAALRLL